MESFITNKFDLNRVFIDHSDNTVRKKITKFTIVKEMCKKSESHERKLRENNLVIFDFKEDTSETPESLRATVEEKIMQRLRLTDVIIDLVYRKGQRDSEKTRPVILRLVKLWDRERILKAKRNWSEVSIREDLTPEQRQERKIIGSLVSKAKSQGKEASHERTYAIIEGTKISYEQAKQGLETYAARSARNHQTDLMDCLPRT